MKRHPILIAEDNQDHVILLRRALQKRDFPHPIFVVDDGEETIAYLDGRGRFGNRDEYPLPALLLLDLKMPRKGGLEVLQWIRAQPLLRRTIVLILSASGQAVDVDAAYESGANAYLVKPATLEERNQLIGAMKEFWLVWNTHPSREPVPEVSRVSKL